MTPEFFTKLAKRRWRLLPWSALTPIVDAMMVGAAKYGDDNWKHVDAIEFENAVMRHLNDHFCGAPDDAETGLPHLALAGANILILLAKMQQDHYGSNYEAIVARSAPPRNVVTLLGVALEKRVREGGP